MRVPCWMSPPVRARVRSFGVCRRARCVGGRQLGGGRLRRLLGRSLQLELRSGALLGRCAGAGARGVVAEVASPGCRSMAAEHGDVSEFRPHFELHRQAQVVPLDGATDGLADTSQARIILVHSTEEYREQARSLPRAADLRPALAIDIGSAYGHTTEILARELGSNEAVVGIDVGWKFVDESRKRCPHLRFERLDVLEDQQFVIQLVNSYRATRTTTSVCAPSASCGGRGDAPRPVTQPVRHPPKRSRNTELTGATVSSLNDVEVFTCRACSKTYSSADYRSGAAGAKGALAQHVRDMHACNASIPTVNIAKADEPDARKKVTSYICTSCSVRKGLAEFSKNQRNGRKSEIQCKTCNAELRAARRKSAMRERGLLPPASAQSQAQLQPDPQPGQEPQLLLRPQPTTPSEPGPGSEPEPEPELQPQPQSQPQAQPQPGVKPKPTSKPELTEQSNAILDQPPAGPSPMPSATREAAHTSMPNQEKVAEAAADTVALEMEDNEGERVRKAEAAAAARQEQEQEWERQQEATRKKAEEAKAAADAAAAAVAQENARREQERQELEAQKAALQKQKEEDARAAAAAARVAAEEQSAQQIERAVSAAAAAAAEATQVAAAAQ